MIINGKIQVIDYKVLIILQNKKYYDQTKIGQTILKNDLTNLEAFFDAGFKDYCVDNSDLYVWNFIHNIIKRKIVEFEDKKTFTYIYKNFDINKDKYANLSELEAVTNGDILTVFKNSSIGSFDEFEYFIGLTEIPPYCFENSTVTSIVIPETVTKIGEGAFKNTENLTTVVFQEGVTEIGSDLFNGSTISTIVFLGSTVPEIDETTFANIPENCKIFVPKDYIKEYRSASEAWANLKTRIYTLDDDADMWEELEDYFKENDDPDIDAIPISNDELDEIINSF